MGRKQESKGMPVGILNKRSFHPWPDRRQGLGNMTADFCSLWFSVVSINHSKMEVTGLYDSYVRDICTCTFAVLH